MIDNYEDYLADANDADDIAMGWQAYLEENLHFPFRARCVEENERSPLEEGEIVTVTGLATCDTGGMFVKIRFEKRALSVPLDQLLPVRAGDDDGDDEDSADEDGEYEYDEVDEFESTLQAARDWQEWWEDHRHCM